MTKGDIEMDDKHKQNTPEKPDHAELKPELIAIIKDAWTVVCAKRKDATFGDAMEEAAQAILDAGYARALAEPAKVDVEANGRVYEVLLGLYSLLNVCEQEWRAENAWTEYDQQVMDAGRSLMADAANNKLYSRNLIPPVEPVKPDRECIMFLLSLGFAHKIENGFHVVEGHGFKYSHIGLLNIATRIKQNFFDKPVEPARQQALEEYDKSFRYGIQWACEAQDRQTVIDRLVEVCERTIPLKAALSQSPAPDMEKIAERLQAELKPCIETNDMSFDEVLTAIKNTLAALELIKQARG